MHLSSTRRRMSVAATAAALLGASLTFAPAAQAAPVFGESTLTTSSDAFTSSGDCTTTDTSSTADVNTPIVENGPAVNFTRSHTASFQHDTVPEDNGSLAASVTGSVQASSVGTGSFSVDYKAQGSASMTSALATSGCTEFVQSYGEARLDFTVAQAGWLLLEVKNRGAHFTEGYVEQIGVTDVEADSWGWQFKYDSVVRIFLPAGTYELYLDGYIDLRSNTARSVSGSSSVHAEFVQAGAQTAAPEGKGGKYVKFPASRNCAAHTLTPTVTEKGKRAKKIQSVKFYVNDKLVKKVRNPSKGEAVAVPIADDVDADVLAKVKLEKVKKGVPAKKFEVTSSYIACS